MLGKAKERSRESAVLDSPALNTRLLVGGGRGLLDEGDDDSGFMDLNSKDFDKLNLVDTPPVRRVDKTGKTQAHISSPSKSALSKRPSWGPKSSPSKGKMRLLEGLEETNSTSHPPQAKRKERTLGGLGQDKGGMLRPRQSLFVKPAYLQNRRSEGKETVGDNERDEEGDDSFYKDTALSSSTGSVKDKIAAIEAGRSQTDLKHIPVINGSGSESKEQMDNQLAELKKMNDVFEGYERMLSGSADQVENFAQRISETNSLLDIYIDLMRQADRTQQLLLDSNWKGATEDESAHALALELAERERRRKQEEAEEAARVAAIRRKEAEQARLEAEKAEQRRIVGPSARGARGGAGVGRGAAPSVRGRGAAPTTSRLPSATRGRTVSSTASSRGASTASRGAAPGTTTASSSSTASGLNNKYAGVRSSGYGPPR